MIVAIVPTGAGTIPVEEFRVATDVLAAVAAFCNEHSPALDPADYVGVDTGWSMGTDQTLMPWKYDFPSALLVVDLDAAKQVILTAIKAHRDEQRLGVDLHAEYPVGSGNWFSCSAASQNNWSKLALLDDRGIVQWPYTVTTYDEELSYDVVDSADLTGIITAVAVVVQMERATAAVYMTSVLAAADLAGAQAAAAPYLAL